MNARGLNGLLAALLWAGCAVHSEEMPMDTEGVMDLDEADALKVSVPGFWINVSPTATVVNDGTDVSITFNGTASTRLEQAFTFVPDDAFGEGTVDGRKFALTMRDGHESNTMLSGLPLFVRFMTPGNTNSWFAKVVGAPRIASGRGSTAVWAETWLAPFYVRDDQNHLRYRLAITAPAAATSMQATLNGDVLTAQKVATGRFVVDLAFEQLQAVLGNNTEVTLVAHSPSRNYTKYVKLGVGLKDLGLTTQDPYVFWPEPVCTEALRACLEPQPADLAVCGSYREVASCRGPYACYIDNRKVVMTQMPSPQLDSAVQAFNQAGANAGTCVQVSSAHAYELTGCDVTLESVVNHVTQQTQGWPTFTDGQSTDRPGILNHPFFGTSYCRQGPALMSAVDATIEEGWLYAWSYVSEIPCHNCTDFADNVVLFYPSMQRAVVLEGHHGYDS